MNNYEKTYRVINSPRSASSKQSCIQGEENHEESCIEHRGYLSWQAIDKQDEWQEDCQLHVARNEPTPSHALLIEAGWVEVVDEGNVSPPSANSTWVLVFWPNVAASESFKVEVPEGSMACTRACTDCIPDHKEVEGCESQSLLEKEWTREEVSGD